MARRRGPIGVILAGGHGRRIGGSKAVVELHGQPLISYPLAALQQVVGETVIIAKAETELPSLPGVTVWIEPDEPHHPLLGIIHALSLADRRPVLVCAADLPLVSPAVLHDLARFDPGQAPAVVASSGRDFQPLLGCYQQSALERIEAMRPNTEEPLREIVARLEPALYEVEDPEVLFNVNTPDDLLQAAAMIDRRATRT